MGKKLVMRQDTNYTPSAVYGFEWIEDLPLQKSGAPKGEPLKKRLSRSCLAGMAFLMRHSPFIRAWQR